MKYGNNNDNNKYSKYNNWWEKNVHDALCKKQQAKQAKISTGTETQRKQVDNMMRMKNKENWQKTEHAWKKDCQ